jgi:hypothetical protein
MSESSIQDFKASCNAVSKASRRINSYVPCERCGKVVRRFESQRVQAKHLFCSVACKTKYYQNRHKPVYNQHGFGIVHPRIIQEWLSN